MPCFVSRRGQIPSLIAIKLACRNDGGRGRGGRESDCSRMGEVEGVGMVELVCVGRLLRMVCDSFLMPVCGSVGSGEPGSRMGYRGHIMLRTIGGGQAETKPKSIGGGEGRDRDGKFDFVACIARIVSGWVVVA